MVTWEKTSEDMSIEFYIHVIQKRRERLNRYKKNKKKNKLIFNVIQTILLLESLSES